ncbi:unnamed protein product, partial [Adineta ricciae]
DLCQCFSAPASFCPVNSRLTCSNNTQDDFNQIPLLSSSNQLELHHFNNEVPTYEPICAIKIFSQLKYYRSIVSTVPQCLSSISSIYFVHSTIHRNQFSSDKLFFYKSILNFTNLNLTSTKILTLDSVQFLVKPFHLNSLMMLTHLTITHTEDFYLLGSYPQLSYLNLDHTNLTDKQLNRIFTHTTIPDLTTLILSNNHLTTLGNRFPSTIRYLDLSKNQIKSLNYYSFKSLYSLNILNISFNWPLEIQQDTFTRIPYLEILDISYTLPTLPFDDLFLPLQKLRHLNVSSNALDTLPHLPIPHDAHMIESYDQHLPVLYVDLSNNNFEKLDLDVYSSPSTQDKYILSLNMNSNRIKTLKSSSMLSNDAKRRGPFIEFELMNNSLECDCDLYESVSQLLQTNSSLQRTSAGNSSASNQLINRIRIIRLSNLTCLDLIDPTNLRLLYDLNSSNSFCSYTKSCPSTCSCCLTSISSNDCHCYSQCPHQCSCKHSVDLTHNSINCSNQQLYQIPADLPHSTTHLYLDNNEIRYLDHNFTYLTRLKALSLANNSFEYLTNYDFFTMNRMEYLDLSSNHIKHIQSKTFVNLIKLKKLYLHNNDWMPNFYHQENLFQSNIRLDLLTYGNGLTCNRSTISSMIINERPLTAEDCCSTYTDVYACEKKFRVDRYNLKHELSSTYSKTYFFFILYQKYILFALIICLFVIICLITIYINRKKREFLAKEKLLLNTDLKLETNLYDTKGMKYNQQGNDNSISYTDEDEYASIPLTTSQTDLSSIIHSQTIIPPLPPRRQFISNRPVSHSSTVSTTITSPNFSSLTTTHSCLQIKLDVLVLYSITDSKYIHDNIGQQLEDAYGKRFSFHFIHRDRMLGELDWLIENSCVTILILRKPYNQIHDYMKILSAYASLKCFIILINHEPNHRLISIKAREKIARLYRTSDIFEWNSDPKSLLHEQLDLFLEQNCGSATYVSD